MGDKILSGDVPVTLTAYCPYQSGLTPEQRLMEGGTNDRKGNRLFTLEDHIANPSEYPYVSLACDYTLFPYGQRVIIPSLGDGVIARLVDTGGHFYGKKKVIRNPGHEPIDVCVRQCGKQFFKSLKTDTMTIVEGDILNSFSAAASVVDAVDYVGELANSDTVDELDQDTKLIIGGITVGLLGLTAYGIYRLLA